LRACLDEACYHPVLAELCRALAKWVRGRPPEEFEASQARFGELLDVRQSKLVELEAKYGDMSPVQALCEVTSELVWHARRMRRFQSSLFSIPKEERMSGVVSHLGEQNALEAYVQLRALAALQSTVAAGAPFPEADLRIKTVVQLCRAWLKWGIDGIVSEPPAEGKMSKEETELANGLVEAVAALQRLGLAFEISHAHAATPIPHGKEVDDSDKHDREFMEMAIEEARKSVGQDRRAHPKVGAVVVKGGRVLAAAHRGELGEGEHAEYTALERKLPDETIAGATVCSTPVKAIC
jgi:Cytidine and deoxycytidylate deaminase zinc-binding region